MMTTCPLPHPGTQGAGEQEEGEQEEGDQSRNNRGRKRRREVLLGPWNQWRPPKRNHSHSKTMRTMVLGHALAPLPDHCRLLVDIGESP